MSKPEVCSMCCPLCQSYSFFFQREAGIRFLILTGVKRCALPFGLAQEFAPRGGGETLPADLRRNFWGMPVGVPRLPAESIVATMRRFRAGAPWSSTLHSWTLLDSHDTARFRTVAGSRERHVVGIGLQMTTPGVPMVFAGDELGLEGGGREDARRTMTWDRRDSWDTALLDGYRRLIALRRG